jgi:glucose/arabinose dehydrogenase
LDISRKTATAGERGLLGVAFDPDFTINGYVYYTQRAPGKGRPYNKVVRFTADPDNADRALASSETLLFRLPELMNKNHNGGLYTLVTPTMLTRGTSSRWRWARTAGRTPPNL